MNLVMFDMDGTLTDTFSLDANCYVIAIEQALGLDADNAVLCGNGHTHGGLAGDVAGNFRVFEVSQAGRTPEPGD